MKSLFRPSLTRRVVLALLLGFFLVWIVILLRLLVLLYFQSEPNDRDFGSAPLGTNLRASFSGATDADQVRTIAAALDRVRAGEMQQENAPAQIVLQILDRRDNKVVYASKGVGDAPLRADPHHKT